MKAGWQTKALSEVCDVKGGKRVPKGYKLKNEPTPHPYISVADFTDDGTVCARGIKYVDPEVFAQIKKYTISSDDLYLSIAGTIGKTGSVPPELSGANLTENACKLVLGPEVDKEFLYYVTRSRIFGDYVQSNTRTAAQPKLSLERLKAIPIPIPPLEDQRRIVAILDEAFEGLARANENAEVNLQSARDLFESYLEQTFQEAEENSAEEGLDALIEIKHGFAFKSRDFEVSSDRSRHILLTPGNYGENARLHFTEKNTKRLVSEPPEGFVFRRGELTVVMTDLSSKMKILGKPAFVEQDNLLHNQRIGRIVFKSDRLIPRWLFYFLRTRRALDPIKSTATGTMVRHTAPKRILSLNIPLPSSTSAQELLVSRLDALEEKSLKVYAAYQRSLEEIDDLRQSLLQKAFSGELS